MPPNAPRRVRSRKDTMTFEDEDIVQRVIDFYRKDNEDRSEEKDARIQRYAKYRMWTEGKDWPWPDASDIGLPDMMEKGLRIDDTLHNAVMSSRPVIGAKAVEKRNAGKAETIDNLIDYQIFVEQNGEDTVGDIANAFTTDGEFIVFVPWVKELRETSDSRKFPPIPADRPPVEYFQTLIVSTFGAGNEARRISGDGWDWTVATPNGRAEVSFFVAKEGAEVEMVVKRDVTVYDGPRLIQKEWDEVVYPVRAANLHIPGPSNPHGAGHVILVDYPSVDEVVRLADKGPYDRLSEETIKRLSLAGQSAENQEARDQKDTLQGVAQRPEGAERGPEKPQKTLTRLMCFDVFDADGDGTTEDMVWWVILETESLARAARLTEVFPSRVPRRPLVHRSIIPVRGRVAGIGLPEMLEGLHDAMKAILDQTIDSGTFKNVPFGFYRPFGTMKPETIRMQPGEMYPLGDPSRDVNFPTVNTQGETMGLNLFGILGQLGERLTTIGDLQLGRVPQGKASALRTLGGMSLIAGQGEARPERILRRFFGGLAEIWGVIHEANRHFLPDKKRIRIAGLQSANQDPFAEVARADIDDVFLFDFQANVLNTSKEALQIGLQQVMGVGVSSIAFQLGITDAGGVYRMIRDHAKAWGQNPDRYYKEPAPGTGKTPIFAEEAIATIIDGAIPEGAPAEGGGAAEHLQKLIAFMDPNQDLIAGKEVDFDEFGLLDSPEKVEIFKGYIQQTAQLAAQEQRQAALAAAASEFQNGGEGGRGGRPPEGPPEDPNAPVIQGPGELADETLVGAGGGANTGLGLAG